MRFAHHERRRLTADRVFLSQRLFSVLHRISAAGAITFTTITYVLILVELNCFICDTIMILK